MTERKHLSAAEAAFFQAKFRTQEFERRAFAEQYGEARAPMVVSVGGKLVSALEGGLYAQTREGPYNFMTVLHDHALMFFGVHYLEEEEKRPIEERHPALQWMYYMVANSQRLEPTEQQGFSAAWWRFAYDLFTIRDNAKLELRMKERLLSKRFFQGARHELRVAALCIAAGFNIEFENEKDNRIGHAEFIGTDKTGLRIAVEAKSRHRYGVQGFTEGKRHPVGSKVDIRDIILDAYKKKTPLPLYAFVDANLPSVVSDEQFQEWWAEINQCMLDLESEGYADPCSANILFVCNDPSHYVGDRRLEHDNDNLWLINYPARSPRAAHPASDMVERINRAHRQRVAPPADIPDFNSA
jgi:hypothetical protein